MIQERHAALDGGGHAHLVLLHQQLDQIGLDVGVEQPVQHIARKMASQYFMEPAYASPAIALVSGVRRLFLFRRRERRIEIVEVERGPGSAVADQERCASLRCKAADSGPE